MKSEENQLLQAITHTPGQLKSDQKSKGNQFLKIFEKTWHFDEQGFLIRVFFKPDTASPLCRKMFWESYVAPTRRSEKFFEKKMKLKDQESVAVAT